MSKSGMSLKMDIGIRIGGLFLLLIGACAMKLLYGDFHTSPVHETGPLEMLIAATGFLSLSIGAILVALGRHIFDPVRISARWSEPPRSDRR